MHTTASFSEPRDYVLRVQAFEGTRAEWGKPVLLDQRTRQGFRHPLTVERPTRRRWFSRSYWHWHGGGQYVIRSSCPEKAQRPGGLRAAGPLGFPPVVVRFPYRFGFEFVSSKGISKHPPGPSGCPFSSAVSKGASHRSLSPMKCP